MSCRICPRQCNNGHSFCGGSSKIRLSISSLHFGEEPPLVGSGGSGTLFLSGCNMQCPFCQNWQISRSSIGKELTIEETAQLMMELQKQGAQNINLVTGSHFSLLLCQAIDRARKEGLTIPILWNSSAYESPKSLEALKKRVDIWLPDLKTLDPRVASEIYDCPDYPQKAIEAIEYMVSQGPPQLNEQHQMIRGTMIRHLILPGQLESTRKVLQWYSEKVKDRAWLSLLSQYTPVQIPGETRPIPQNYLSQVEYDQVLQWLEDYQIEEGFFQDLETGSDWLPDFNKDQPFSADLAKVIRRYNHD